MPDIGEAFDLLGKIINFMITIPARVANLVIGATNIILGIAVTTAHLAEIVPMFSIDILNLLGYMFEFVKTYTVCSVYFIANAKRCVLYYIIEMIGFILYMPVRIFLLILNAIGINLYPYEHKVWNGLEQLDHIIVGAAGFHIIYWPKSIRDQCFNCKRLKIDVLMERAGDISGDFFVKAPELLKSAIRLFTVGAGELGQIFSGGSPPMPPAPEIKASDFM
uniref:Uncharacterized protein n=1 Tax=viral metagenome TaxID=1070528 RepID=A0A6C0JJ91_9ZZZZ